MQYSPVIPDSTAPFVHHIVVYLCSNLDNSGVGDSELCDGTHIDIRLCRFTGIVFAGWAVGGNVSLHEVKQKLRACVTNTVLHGDAWMGIRRL